MTEIHPVIRADMLFFLLMGKFIYLLLSIAHQDRQRVFNIPNAPAQF